MHVVRPFEYREACLARCGTASAGHLHVARFEATRASNFAWLDDKPHAGVIDQRKCRAIARGPQYGSGVIDQSTTNPWAGIDYSVSPAHSASYSHDATYTNTIVGETTRVDQRSTPQGIALKSFRISATIPGGRMTVGGAVLRLNAHDNLDCTRGFTAAY